MSEEFTDEEFTDEQLTGRTKAAPMTPADILLGPTLLFDVVPFSVDDHHFPGAIPVSAGRRDP